MKNSLLLGLWQFLVPVPPRIWTKEIARSAKKGAAGLAFMSADHHRVRDFVVSELPRAGAPLPPGLITRCLDLPVEQVVSILDELEKHMTFLFRNPQGEVAWAYPVTVDPTPHRIIFSTGEQVYAA